MSVVDVIVPCYNYAHFLEECVESILSQSHRDLRVLIINDASSDNTHEVAQELLRRDSRVSYMRHQENRGHIATYNEGLEWVTGEYTLLLSADDALTPGSLARSVQLMDAHPEIAMVHGKAIYIKGDREAMNWERPPMWDSPIISGVEFIRMLCELGGNCVETPTVVVRTDVQQRIGGYRAELPHSGDMEMWLRFAAHGHIGYVHAHQAHYRKHDSNMHYKHLNVRDLEERRAAFSTLFDAYDGLIPNIEDLRGLAMRRVAESGVGSAYEAFERQQIETCEACLDFAVATVPEAKVWKTYRRMRLKLRLGTRLWSKIRLISGSAAPREPREVQGRSLPESGVGQRLGPT